MIPRGVPAPATKRSVIKSMVKKNLPGFNNQKEEDQRNMIYSLAVAVLGSIVLLTNAQYFPDTGGVPIEYVPLHGVGGC
jgi:hypothetical protein